MIRKLFIFLLCLLPLGVAAQLATGTWKVYGAFGKPDKLLETPHFVYLLTQGSLHSYDKDNDESRSYMPGDDLSGHLIKNIFYNEDRHYLTVCYTDGNIDLLYDDGRLVNLPDIRDANLSVSKVINDVKFDGDRIYVATTFGLVVFSESTADVKESGIYDVNVSMVGLTPDHIIIYPLDGEKAHHVLAIEKTARLHSLGNYKTIGTLNDNFVELIPVGDGPDDQGVSHFLIRDNTPYLARISLRCGENPLFDAEFIANPVPICFKGKDASYYISKGRLYEIKLPWSVREVAVLPSFMNDNIVATASGASSVWAAGTDGLGHYRLDSDGGVTVLRDKFRPSGVTTFSDISRFFPSSDGRGFYISNLGISHHRPIGGGDFYETMFTGNFISDGKIEDVTIDGPMTYRNSPSANEASKKYGSNHIFAPAFVIEDPDDHTIRYIGSGLDGLFVVKDGQEIVKFDENSSIYKAHDWAWRTNDACFDKDGNLIVAVFTSNIDASPLAVLPASKRRGKDLRSITKEDWINLEIGKFINQRDIDLLLCKHSPMIFMIDATWHGGFAALHHGGTVADPSDDRNAVVNIMTDQDGKTFTPNYAMCLLEDNRGRVWCGTTSGIFEITNPLGVFSPDFHINRLKVPRNDGTNLADYLLESETVYCMAVDAANRKWIGTADSGVYLVSENGDEVIANFNTSNSPLSTNTITDLYVDPNSNSVFIATLHGLYEYSSTTSPARPDYSDVYAYPNPVEPGYSGWITIKGLMDNSLVKIVDSGMHLVYQTTSQGGMAVWDGCSMSGARVRSGVYYVLASTSDDTMSEGDVVTKILVVN